METWVLAPVLLAAVLHAGWNLLVKMRGDKLVMMGVIDAGHGLLSLPLLLFFPFPHAAAWPFIFASALLHVGYKLFLVRAYHHADMGVVYPIARGMAPALVALGAFVFAGENLSSAQLAAIIAIAVAISGLTFANGWRNIPLIGLSCAVGTAIFIASYTVVDGMGARQAGSAHAYALWMFVCDAVVFTLVVLARRGKRLFLTTALEYWRPGMSGAAMSMGAYWIVIWAMSITPMAPVSAVRETSVLFGALLAGFVLKEGRIALRLLAAIVIAGGVVSLQF